MKVSLLIRSVMLTVTMISSNVWAGAWVPGPLVDNNWLVNNLDKVVVLDVRHDTKSFSKRSKSKLAGIQACGGKKGNNVSVNGHISGASLISWKKVRRDRVMDGRKLHGVIISRNSMQSLMQAAGVNNDSAIVITYKGAASKDLTFATRLYWQLKYFGHDNVTILNGGTAGWIAAGHQVKFNRNRSMAGNWQAGKGRADILATTEDVKKAVANGNQLIDARTEDYYLGAKKKKYVYAKGHIKGAKNFPHPLMLADSKQARLAPLSNLENLMRAKRISKNVPTITFCDSGHLSSGTWFILHELQGNKQARLYDGSMNEWTQFSGVAVSTNP